MDLNKSFWDQWSQGLAPAKKAAEEPANPFTALYDQYKSIWSWNPFQPVTSSSTDPLSYAQGVYKQWEKGVRDFTQLIPNPLLKDSYDRFLGSYRFFNDLQSFWQQNLENFQKLPKDMAGWVDYFKPLADQYQQMTAPLLEPFAPGFMTDSLKSVYNANMEGLTNVQKLVADLYQPVIEASPELMELFVKAAQGDRDAYLELLRKAGEAYREMSSKLLSMPAFGGNRKLIEKTQKLVDQYTTYVVRAAEYQALFSQTLNESMEKLVQHLLDLQGKGEYPTTFKEFYTVWSDFNEKAFLDLFASDAFERVMNDTVAAGSKFKILYDDFLQDVYEPLPFPNRREMDSVEEKIYDLRKEVKALKKEVAALKAGAGTTTTRSTRRSA
jgi:class III poly(R)-hydroxyalkanoic acid synthase PhaE subunit